MKKLSLLILAFAAASLGAQEYVVKILHANIPADEFMRLQKTGELEKFKGLEVLFSAAVKEGEKARLGKLEKFADVIREGERDKRVDQELREKLSKDSDNIKVGRAAEVEISKMGAELFAKVSVSSGEFEGFLEDEKQELHAVIMTDSFTRLVSIEPAKLKYISSFFIRIPIISKKCRESHADVFSAYYILVEEKK